MAGSSKDELTAYEENTGFYHQLGLAITAWAHVELALMWVFGSCFTKHTQQRAVITFYSIENFRSKLQVVDRIFKTKHSRKKLIKTWEGLYVDLQRLSTLRNHLVHYFHMGYPTNRAGRRDALIPQIGPSTRYRQRTPKPPPGSLCIRDIMHARQRFNALAFGLEFLVYEIKKQKTQLPASLARPGNVPTMAYLTRQIRTILQRPPSPSGGSP